MITKISDIKIGNEYKILLVKDKKMLENVL